MNNVVDAKSIFQAAVTTANPNTIINDRVKLVDSNLYINNEKVCNLDSFKKIFIIGAGTASSSMASSIETLLENFKDKIDTKNSLIITKYNHFSKLKYINQFESSHPLPDENSLKAGEKLIQIADKADKDTLVFCLISGGASSLVEYYIDHLDLNIAALTLKDNQNITAALHGAGCKIEETNIVRKHLSMIKGGELAKRLYPSTTINLILSDVLSNNLDTVGSGLTTADPSSWQDAKNIIEKYKVKLPKAARDLIEAGLLNKIRETPKEDDECFKKVKSFLIGSIDIALVGAEKRAQKLGYNTVILNHDDSADVDQLSKHYLDLALKNIDKKEPMCFISTAIPLAKTKGKGKSGQNLNLALSLVSKMEEYLYKISFDDQDRILFLFASTDGSDGMTSVAGAFANFHQAFLAQNRGLVPIAYLEDNDAFGFFTSIGGLYRTGPTKTNVCNIHIILIK